MKKVVSLILFCVICNIDDVSAQDVVSVFWKDSVINEFLLEDIDSIVYRNEDPSNAIGSTYDTQVVYTKNGPYSIPLDLVDSVSLQQPLSNGYLLNPSDLGDWDEGYVYQSTNDDDMSVVCMVKQQTNGLLMYLNRINSLLDSEEGYIFVLDNNGDITSFIHNGVYFSLTYGEDNITTLGIDTLGNVVFNHVLSQAKESSNHQKGQRGVSLDNIIGSYDTFARIFDALSMANMAGRGAWMELFYSIFKVGIDMSKYFKPLNIYIRIVEIYYQIASFELRTQLYSLCQVNVGNVEHDVTSNTATVTLDIRNASYLSYVYYETESHYNYLHTEYEEPYTYVSVPHTVNQYYAGIVVKKNRPYVSYSDYDTRLPLNQIDKMTSTTSFILSDLEVGQKYYIRPYILADVLINDNELFDFLDGGILYGPIYEFVFNGISLDFSQNSCTYLGNNEMAVSFYLSADIASLNDVNAWGVIVKDRNDNEIGVYYAESSSSSLSIDEQIIVNKDLFNSDNVTEINLCPFYIYGFHTIPIYDEISKYDITWSVNLITEKANDSSITEQEAQISGISDGFVVTDSNNIQIGFCYTNINSQPNIENATFALGNLEGGISTGTSGRLFFSSILNGLNHQTTYYYRVCAIIDGSYYYAENVESFTTKGCPNDNHPHMIDLGLPSGTKWACCNVGATTPEEYGNYYAWGETQPKSVYSWGTYQYYDVNIGSDIAGTSYDAATVNWGAPWRMPSLTQIQELLNNCSSEFTTQNGVNGQKITGPNGGSIFLPAAGYRWNSDLRSAGTYGSYWSSSLDGSSTYNAYILYFNSGPADWSNLGRLIGSSVRPVR